MKLSLVIRCLNEEKHIGKLLAGVMEQTVKDVEVVVVDSGSTDATLSIASRFPVKIVHIKPEDFSFGGALHGLYDVYHSLISPWTTFLFETLFS